MKSYRLNGTESTAYPYALVQTTTKSYTFNHAAILARLAPIFIGHSYQIFDYNTWCCKISSAILCFLREKNKILTLNLF